MGYWILLAVCVIGCAALSAWGADYHKVSAALKGAASGLFIMLVLFLIVGSVLDGAADRAGELDKIDQLVPINQTDPDNPVYLVQDLKDDVIVYHFAVKREFGVTTETLPMHEVYIEESTKDPAVERYNKVFKNEFLRKWFPNIGDTDMVKLIVPEDSVDYTGKMPTTE